MTNYCKQLFGKKALMFLIALVLSVTLFAAPAAAENDEAAEIVKVIYFQNMNTGEVDAWIIEDLEVVDTVSIGTAPGEAWHVAAVHDIDGSGSPDLIWQTTFGRLAVWMMNGLEPVGDALPYGQEFVNTNFSLVDLHDMNADGKPDAIFQNMLWGNRNVWFMDSDQFIDGRRFAVAGVNWRIAAVNDMGGDGKINVIWEHLVDGRRNYWTLDDNLERIVEQSGNFFQTGSEWTIAAVHDMNGDWNPDVIWEHTDGRRSIWVMDGLNDVQRVNIDARNDAWRIVGAGSIFEPRQLVSVEEVDDFAVDYNTAFDEIGLPEEVVVTIMSGASTESTETVEVDWSAAEEAYDPHLEGAQDLEGLLRLPEDVQNPDNIKVEVTVTVGPAPVTLFSEAGDYEPAEGEETIIGHARVTAAGVNIKGYTITGNLIITADVGEGTVNLENVTVKGQILNLAPGAAVNATVMNDAQLRKAVLRGATTVILGDDITTPSVLDVNRKLTIEGEKTLTFSSGEMLVRNGVVTLNDITVVVHNPSKRNADHPIHSMGIYVVDEGELVADGITVDVKSTKDVNLAGIRVHWNEKAHVTNAVIKVHNHKQPVFGLYAGYNADVTVEDTHFELERDEGDFLYAIGAQNFGPPAAAEYLFPALNVTGSTHTGASHAAFIFMQDRSDAAQLAAAQALAAALIAANPELPDEAYLFPTEAAASTQNMAQLSALIP